MFADFFYTLRRKKVPVTLTEWMTLMEALAKGYITNLEEFYYLARAILVKSEALFDQYDLAFQEYFKGVETLDQIRDEILDWLNDPKKFGSLLSPEEMQTFQQMDLEELMREFEKRMQEQTELHDGGHHWIGRGGTSPFGHSGRHPAGIRVGGESKGRSALKVAQERKFKNYRSDLTLDVRQIKVALRGLRQLGRIGPADELDLEKTIDATAQNAGDIDLKWRRSRINATKVLLLMDVGGSMAPYAQTCSRLFTAAHSVSHFKDFKYYYFHNCIYDNLYVDIERSEPTPTESLLFNLDRDYKVVLVGDARMASTELTHQNGIVNYYERNDRPGILWLKQIADHFSHCVWMNPEEKFYWNHPTVLMIGKIFPMYELTLEGLAQGIKKLVVKR
ncbi:MAG: VWA domain-containing protein [Dehalococcoidia bacterium]|nr:VWA domain-containing protein [Dehalococcoidia bacterium]